MILDTSAVIAILRFETEASEFAKIIERAAQRRISAVSYVEAGAAIDGSKDPVASRRFDELIEAAQIDRFGFDVELIYLAHLAGLRLCEIPVRWNHDPASKISVMRDSFRMIDEVRRVRRDAARGVYDAAIEAARAVPASTHD